MPKGIPVDESNAFPILNILVNEGLVSRAKILAAFLTWQESATSPKMTAPTPGNGVGRRSKSSPEFSALMHRLPLGKRSSMYSYRSRHGEEQAIAHLKERFKK